MLDDGVIVQDGTRILPASDWSDALKLVRERTDEDEDNRRQSDKYAERRRKYLQASLHVKDNPTEPTPELPGKEKVRELFRGMDQRDEAARIEEQRSKVGVTVETFIHDTLEQMSKVRMGLLWDLWADKGGDKSHVLPGVRRLGCKLQRLPEHDNELFVFPRPDREVASDRETPATVTEIPAREKPAESAEPLPEPPPASESPPKQPPKVDGVFVHGDRCDCFLCGDDAEPSYAHPVEVTA